MRFKHSATLPAPKLQMLAQSFPQNVFGLITAMPCLQCLFRCSLLSFAMTQSNSGQGSVPVTYICTLQCITGGQAGQELKGEAWRRHRGTNIACCSLLDFLHSQVQLSMGGATHSGLNHPTSIISPGSFLSGIATDQSHQANYVVEVLSSQVTGDVHLTIKN